MNIRFAILLLPALVTSCLKPCDSEEEQYLSVQFRSSTGTQVEKLLGLHPDGYTVPMYINGTYGQVILDPASEKSRFIFYTSKNEWDTFTLAYTRSFLFESSRCGFDIRMTNIRMASATFPYDSTSFPGIINLP